MTPEPHL